MGRKYGLDKYGVRTYDLGPNKDPWQPSGGGGGGDVWVPDTAPPPTDIWEPQITPTSPWTPVAPT